MFNPALALETIVARIGLLKVEDVPTLMNLVTVYESSGHYTSVWLCVRIATESPGGKTRSCTVCVDRRRGHFGLVVRSYERQF